MTARSEKHRIDRTYDEAWRSVDFPGVIIRAQLVTQARLAMAPVVRAVWEQVATSAFFEVAGRIQPDPGSFRLPRPK